MSLSKTLLCKLFGHADRELVRYVFMEGVRPGYGLVCPRCGAHENVTRRAYLRLEPDELDRQVDREVDVLGGVVP